MAEHLETTTTSIDSLNREIAERERIENELRFSEERFRILFECALDAYFLHDLQGRLLDVNKKAEQLTGYGREEQIGRTIIDFGAVPPSQTDRILSMAAENAAGRPSGPTEVILRHKDGSLVTVEVMTLPVQIKGDLVVLGIAHDVTERRKMEEELRSSEERFKQVAESAEEFIWEVDADGLYTYANPVVEKVLGYQPQDIVGKKHFYDFFLPEERENLKKMALEGFARKEAFRGFVNSNTQGSGRVVILETSGLPIVDNQGNLRGYRGADTDITERMLAQERLRQQTELLRNIISNIPHFVFWKDRNSAYLGCNEVFAKSAGLESPDEIIGKTDYDLVWKKDADSYRQYDRQVMESGEPLLNFDEGQTRQDGSQIALLTSKVPLRDASGKVVGILGIYNDITDRKRAEEALELNNIILRTQQELSIDGILVVDEKGEISSFNQRFIDMWGIPFDVVESKSDGRACQSVVDQLASPEEFIRQVKHLYEARDETSRDEVALKDGRIFDRYSAPMQGARGKYYGRVWYFRDITERKLAEQALRESEVRFRSLVEQAGDGFELLDAEGRYVDVNSAVCRQLGYSKDEMLRLSIPDVNPLMNQEKYAVVFQSLTSQAPITFESVHRRKDGTTFPVEVTVSAIQLHGVPLALALVRDITERKQAEKQQTQLFQQLSEINQELKDFAHIVSHDLKAPLRAIGAIADWLRADYTDKLDDQGKEYLTLLTSRVSRMQGLIDGVLQYSRIGRTEQGAAPVDLDRLLPEIVENLGVPAHIAIEVEPDLPTVEADVTRITQVFQNLLSNAIKYMDKPQGRVTVAYVTEEGFWKFSVADNGPGIEPKYFERIFKLFQTLAPRDSQESTGVGLTITKKIVETYGGKIWVESEVGQGSTFFFTFPKKKEADGLVCAAAGVSCGEATVSPGK